MRITVERTIKIDINIETLAELFCSMDDEDQAQFFIESARIMREMCEEHKNRGKLIMGASWQWMAIGSHLKTCQCSTHEALDMIKEIQYGIDHPSHT